MRHLKVAGDLLIKKCQLIDSAILLLLLSYIFAYRLFISSNCGYVVTTCPEMLTYKILLSTYEIPCYLYCAFAFDETYYLGNSLKTSVKYFLSSL